MKIDFEKIKNLTGCDFENIENLYFYVCRLLEVLKVNNKNYTKDQMYKINDLFDIVSCISLD